MMAAAGSRRSTAPQHLHHQHNNQDERQSEESARRRLRRLPATVARSATSHDAKDLHYANSDDRTSTTSPNTISAKLADLHRQTLRQIFKEATTNRYQSNADNGTTTTIDDLYQAYVGTLAESKSSPKPLPASVDASSSSSSSASPSSVTSRPSSRNNDYWCLSVTLAILIGSVALAVTIGQPLAAYLLGIRCFVPNNYLVWEATRPVTDCSYCRNVRRPLILPNMTRDEFAVSAALLFCFTRSL